MPVLCYSLGPVNHCRGPGTNVVRLQDFLQDFWDCIAELPGAQQGLLGAWLPSLLSPFRSLEETSVSSESPAQVLAAYLDHPLRRTLFI